MVWRISPRVLTIASIQLVTASRLVKRISRCMAVLPAASRVVSRKPPAVNVFMSRQEASRDTAFIRAALKTNGRWLTPATKASCSPGSIKNGSAPAAETRPSTVRTASSDAVTDGETHQVAPTKRSASAPSTLCVFPAMGWVPTKLISLGRISAAHFKTCAFVDPVSVMMVPGRRWGTRSCITSRMLLTGVASTTTSASRAALERSQAPLSTAPSFSAARWWSRLGSNPTTSSGLRPSTFRSSDQRRKASPIEPPISPSPTINTRCIGGRSLSSIGRERQDRPSRLIRLRVDLADPAFITGFVAEPHPTIAVARILGWCVLVEVLQRRLGRKRNDDRIGRRWPRTEIDRLASTDLMRGLEILRGRGIGRCRRSGLGRFGLDRDRWFIASWLLTGRFGRFGCLLNLRGGRDDRDEVGERSREPGEEPSRAENADSDRQNHRNADHEAGATRLLSESRAESRVGHTTVYPTDVGAGTGASSIIADASV